MERDTLSAILADLLQIKKFKDYAPNGLQVEGLPTIKKIVSGVTACQGLIDAAIDAGADTILVHHGLFWRGQSACVTGWMRKRLQALLASNINLFAYHLPLDAHVSFGNNAQLGRLLGLAVTGYFGNDELGWLGAPMPGTQFDTIEVLISTLESKLNHTVLAINSDSIKGRVTRIAWCSGGAQDWFEAAIAAGAQVFISGEVSEQQFHYARESGVAYLACGHHATERFGVQALGQHLAQEYGFLHEFIDIPNPV
jgi:dinuclear metal center YbgI/SA1388 family protein